jgi:hypothetical protein
MRQILFTAVAACAVIAAGAAYAQRNPLEPVQPSYVSSVGSAAQLNALLAQWNRIGFNPPSKPGQFRVYGRDGHVTSGPLYNTMVSLIRSAANDSRLGREQEALTKIAKLRGLLGQPQE